MAAVNTSITIGLMNGTVNFVQTEVEASTVGELRSELGLTGSIAINDVIVADSTAIEENMDISHVSQGVKGGN